LIKKVIKRNGKLVEERNLDKLAYHDKIYYICPNCKKEVSKEKHSIQKNGWICKGCKIGFNNSKVKSSQMKKYWEDVDEKTISLIVKKREETCLKKYGVTSPQKNEAIKEKTKKTIIEKYGELNLKNKKFREESARKSILRYGSKNNISKIKKTNMKKYGVENVFSLDETKEKSKKTNMKKYGVEYASQSDLVKEKMMNTNMKKYGVINYNQNNEVRENKRKSYFKTLEKRCEKLIPLFSEKDFISTSIEHLYSWKCKECGNIFKGHLYAGNTPICRKCFPYSTSYGESYIKKYLIDNNIDFTQQKTFENCKDERKLPFDFYLSNYNTLIEYDGQQHYKAVDFFGGEKAFIKQQLHDKIKTEYTEKKGINLIRIRYDDKIEDKLKALFK